MEKMCNNSNALKVKQTKEDISKVAAKLKGKELFPDKLKQVSEFFQRLEIKNA